MNYRPFRIEIAQEAIEDLRRRLQLTRWPDEVQHAAWDYGVPLEFMRDLVQYWATSFDWRTQERRMNSFRNYRTILGGMGIHFIYERGHGPSPTPLLITHGWPSSFLEMLDLIPLLTDPGRYGGDPAEAFDVIVPSIPGYGFSDRPIQRGFTYPDVAGLWLLLMDELGYKRFGAHAHDHGAAIMTRINVGHPERIVGYHTTEPSIPGANMTLQSADLTDAERAFLELRARWQSQDDGYARIQSTRPQTLAYGLNDSPTGLAAWLLDKWFVWTAPPSGNLENHFSKDQLLSMVSLYWFTETVNAAGRAYYEGANNTRKLPVDYSIQVPTGISLVATQPIERPPREFVERRYRDIRYWVELGRGGHFVSGEEPRLLAESIRAFFRLLRS
jgi:pimeloyl-ACP methyl ester carboxylesterase